MTKEGDMSVIKIKKHAAATIRIFILPLICIVCITGLCGCIGELKTSIDDAITKIEKTSDDWEAIMNELVRELNRIPGQVSSIIKVDVQNLLDRGIASAGEEFRCNADIIGLRMADALKRIANDKIYHSEYYQVDPLLPVVCHAIPDALDRTLIPDRLNELAYSGQDFDLDCIKLYLQKSDTTLVDITDFLSVTTHYHITVNLGLNGVMLDKDSDKIILKCGDVELSTVPVIQGTTDYTIPETTLPQYYPPLVEGDREFDGNGPHVIVNVDLVVSAAAIECTLYMRARETQSDWSTAEGSQRTLIYEAPPGYYIKDVLIPTSDSLDYTDSNHSMDYFARGASGLVKSYTAYGDRSGDDIEVYTSVTVELNQIPIVLAQQ
jgi:hypothetical protein